MKIIKTTITTCIIIISIVSMSYVYFYDKPKAEHFYADNFAKLGFKPVADECPYPDSNGTLHDNFMYRQWCEENFVNGRYIYEAFKDVAFNIKYTPEKTKTDFWQTPFETTKSKNGDCEDAVFVFFSHLPSNQENAMITWGWVIDKRSRVARAHVWYELVDMKGQKYIVEGFSNDWNGIIPIEIVEKTESRKPIFTITHSEVSILVDLLLETDDSHAYKFLKNATFRRNSTNHIMLQNISKETSNILKKLRGMFLRYEKQKVEIETVIQISNTSDLRYNNINNNIIQ